MEQFNIYKDGTKVSTTDDTAFEFADLQSDTEYTLGVSRMLDGRESEVVTIKAKTDEEIVEPPFNSETEEIEQYHAGAGWYELPNGEKVRGKDNAVKMLEDLLDE